MSPPSLLTWKDACRPHGVAAGNGSKTGQLEDVTVAWIPANPWPRAAPRLTGVASIAEAQRRRR